MRGQCDITFIFAFGVGEHQEEGGREFQIFLMEMLPCMT